MKKAGINKNGLKDYPVSKSRFLKKCASNCKKYSHLRGTS